MSCGSFFGTKSNVSKPKVGIVTRTSKCGALGRILLLDISKIKFCKKLKKASAGSINPSSDTCFNGATGTTGMTSSVRLLPCKQKNKKGVDLSFNDKGEERTALVKQ